MRTTRQLVLAALLCPQISTLGNTITASSKVTFGPQHCISVSRSEKTGTCVLETKCENIKLDEVEFAFTCRRPGILQKHSFGKGGFDPVEEFDTSVKCDVCGLPSEVGLSLKRAQFLGSKTASTETNIQLLPDVARSRDVEQPASPARRVGIKAVSFKTQEPAEAETATTEFEYETARNETAANATATNGTANATISKVSYGPQNCITTWLQPDAAAAAVNVTDGEAGVCVVATNCSHIPAATFAEYPIGVIAVNKDNIPVRHLLGKNSFDPLEEFNTLIRATSCVGLDETAEAITLNEEVKALSKIVFGLKGQVQKLAGQSESTQALIREDHELLVKNDELAEKERVEEERERRDEERDEQLREAEREREEDADQDGRSKAQLDDETQEDSDAAGDFEDQHEGQRMHREERRNEAEQDSD